MYKAVFYVGGKRPGEMIPDGMLTKERAAELEAMGAIEKIGPFFMSEETETTPQSLRDSSPDKGSHDGEANDTSSAPSGHLPLEGEGEDETAGTADGAEESEAEAPEIDLMDAIVEEDAPQEPASKRGRGSRNK